MSSAIAGAAGRDREALGTGRHFKELLRCRKAQWAKVNPGRLCCTPLGPVWPVAEQVPSQTQGLNPDQLPQGQSAWMAVSGR